MKQNKWKKMSHITQKSILSRFTMTNIPCHKINVVLIVYLLLLPLAMSLTAFCRSTLSCSESCFGYILLTIFSSPCTASFLDRLLEAVFVDSFVLLGSLFKVIPLMSGNGLPSLISFLPFAIAVTSLCVLSPYSPQATYKKTYRLPGNVLYK